MGHFILPSFASYCPIELDQPYYDFLQMAAIQRFSIFFFIGIAGSNGFRGYDLSLYSKGLAALFEPFLNSAIGFSGHLSYGSTLGLS